MRSYQVFYPALQEDDLWARWGAEILVSIVHFRDIFNIVVFKMLQFSRNIINPRVF